MIRFIIFILTLLVLAVAITVSTLNIQIIELDFYFRKFSGPIPFFLFVSFLVGCFLTLLFFLAAYIKHKSENINLKKSMKIKEDEIDSLRKNPLREDN